MREAFAAVLAGFQSLGHDDCRERPIDRLGALAYAQKNSELASLGVDLIALKYSGREASREPAAQKLADILGWSSNKLKLDERTRLAIARWAITEWVKECCPTCMGTREMPNQQDVDGAQPMKPCTDCGASGLRKWTDKERERVLGEDYGKALGLAHAHIGAAAAEAIRGAKRMLERY